MGMNKRNIIFILLILTGIAGLFTYFQSLPSLLEKKPTLVTGKILARPMVIDNFELIDQNNKAFNNKSLEGGWTVLFFGYTNCPDVCPTTIYKLAEVKNELKDGSFELCHACRTPVSKTQIKSKKYLKGVSCPKCFGKISAAKKKSLIDRNKQISIAKRKGLYSPFIKQTVTDL